MSRFFALSLLLLVALGSSRARAQPAAHAVGRVAVLGGYDDNPSLARDPGARLLPGRGASFRELPGSGVLSTRGLLAGELGGATWALARLDFDLAWLSSKERRGEGALTLSAGHDGRRLFGRASVGVGRYGASFGLDDATYLRGGLSTGFGTPQLRIEASLLGAFRAYDAGGQRDGSVGGELAFELRRDRLRLRVATRGDDRFSNSPDASRVELGAGANLRVDVSRLVLGASIAWQQRLFREVDRDGYELTAELSARLRLNSTWRALTILSWGAARGTADALRYDRVAILAGVEVRLEHPAPLLPQRPDSAVRVEGEEIVFHVHYPDATRVQVVGDFDHWDGSAGELRPAGDGYFEGRFHVAPGRHRYRLLVDSAPTLPPGERGVSDDFGGVDAVVYVP